ncbi:MAG: hypothetical protein Q9168_008011 [Polycauliona sp. 1 TL-2023]
MPTSLIYVFQKWFLEMDKDLRAMERRDWATDPRRARVKPLIAALYDAFAVKAMGLLAKNHPELVPSVITDDSSRISVYAQFVKSIPEEVYDNWGLPGYQSRVADNFVRITSVNRLHGLRYDHIDLADIMTDSFFERHRRQDRDFLDPIFMFVHGKSFEEVDEERMRVKPKDCFGLDAYRDPLPQWEPEQGRQAWRREPGKRGKRSGGR